MEEGIKDNAASAPNLRSTNQFRALLPMRVLQVFLLLFVLVLGFSVVSMHMIKYLKIQTLAPSTLISPYDERTTLESFIKPSSSAWHFLNDSELLWRASMEPGILKYPFKRVPKMAFMFLTKGPLPFAPLWERFFKGHEGFYSIYVHALPNYRSDVPSSSVFYRRQIPSQVLLLINKRLLFNVASCVFIWFISLRSFFICV